MAEEDAEEEDNNVRARGIGAGENYALLGNGQQMLLVEGGWRVLCFSYDHVFVYSDAVGCLWKPGVGAPRIFYGRGELEHEVEVRRRIWMYWFFLFKNKTPPCL